MTMRRNIASFARNIVWRLAPALKRPEASDALWSRILLTQGNIAARQVRAMKKIDSLHDVEFSIFSQWGEDGIIEWLVHQEAGIPESFIEFGVENYVESSTRFLLQHRNWRGLVIDGSQSNISQIKNDKVSWRHDVESVDKFITAENINEIINHAGFSGDIGLLSVDIDGNDYWVWDAINVVRPSFVIAEYNSAFGDLLPLTVPYDASFVRSGAHHSNLYYGASIQALIMLGRSKGYSLLGTNTAGSNAFFARDDIYSRVGLQIEDKAPRPSRFREARDSSGQLLHTSGLRRSATISHLPVTKVDTGETAPLSAFGSLYSPAWRSLLADCE